MFRSLRENFVLKMIALAASVMMWLYVTTERNPAQSVTRTVFAEIRPVGSPPPDLIVRPRPDPIAVEVHGPKSEVESLKENDVKARVNVAAARADVTSLPIQGYEAPATAPNVTFKDVGAGMVGVDVTRKQQRKMRIEAAFNNDAPLGARYSVPRLDPVWATVVGSHADIERVARLIVFIETHGGSIRTDLPIHAQDKDSVLLPGVQVEPATAHVDLDLVEAPATRTLIVSVPHEGSAAYPYEISDIVASPDQVIVMGKPEQLLQMTSVSAAPVLVDGIKSDVTREVPLRLPAGVTVKGHAPVVRVTVKVRDTTRVRP